MLDFTLDVFLTKGKVNREPVLLGVVRQPMVPLFSRFIETVKKLV